MSRQRKWGIILGVFVFALFIPWPGLFGALRITHGQSGQELLLLPFIQRHPFDLQFINSIYSAPTREKFEVDDSAIRLCEIVTSHWGVVEYYNSPGVLREENGQIHIRDIQLRRPQLRLAIGFVGKQELLWEGKSYPLYQWVQPGEVLVLEAVSLSPAEYLYQWIWGGRRFGDRAQQKNAKKNDKGTLLSRSSLLSIPSLFTIFPSIPFFPIPLSPDLLIFCFPIALSPHPPI